MDIWAAVTFFFVLFLECLKFTFVCGYILLASIVSWFGFHISYDQNLYEYCEKVDETPDFAYANSKEIQALFRGGLSFAIGLFLFLLSFLIIFWTWQLAAAQFVFGITLITVGHLLVFSKKNQLGISGWSMWARMVKFLKGSFTHTMRKYGKHNATLMRGWLPW